MEQPDRRKHPVPAVAAVVVRDGEILLVRRGKEPSKGKWSVPGGSVEWGETLAQAVKREVREETGLETEVGDVAGVYDLMPTGADGVQYHYVIIDFFAQPTGGTLTPGSDADDARWVPIKDLGQYELTEHLADRLREMGVLPG